MSAPEEAKSLSQQIVETEHILKTLLEQPNGLARRIISKSGGNPTGMYCPHSRRVPLAHIVAWLSTLKARAMGHLIFLASVRFLQQLPARLSLSLRRGPRARGGIYPPAAPRVGLELGPGPWKKLGSRREQVDRYQVSDPGVPIVSFRPFYSLRHCDPRTFPHGRATHLQTHTT